jgi:ABC-type thiamine transport system ATPase subunit
VVQADELLAGLVGGGPHVRVQLGVGVHPGQRLAERPAERVAEVPGLDAGNVLDQPQQAGAGRRQRTAEAKD